MYPELLNLSSDENCDVSISTDSTACRCLQLHLTSETISTNSIYIKYLVNKTEYQQVYKRADDEARSDLF